MSTSKNNNSLKKLIPYLIIQKISFPLFLLCGIHLYGQNIDSLNIAFSDSIPIQIIEEVQEDHSRSGLIEEEYYTNNIFNLGYNNNLSIPLDSSQSKQINPESEHKTLVSKIKEIFLENSSTQQKIPSWMVFILLGQLCFLTLLITVYHKKFRLNFRAMISSAAARNVQRETSSMTRMEDFLLYLFFIINMGIFIFLIPQIMNQNFQFNEFNHLLICVSGLFILLLLKHLQLGVLSVFLPFKHEIAFHNFLISNFNKVVGVVILPFLFMLILLEESHTTLILYFVFCLLSLIYSYMNLLALLNARNVFLFYKFHFFIYLCAVEIAPILILIKFLNII